MASNRKLQGEIDRVLKQIQEHMQEFDQIWQKVHSAPTPNLKEKYEGDLKKEIKKLQRFRDQIKSWAANSDIKNKKPLLDARKAIETEMERFKVLEKETKTKAYSKEGLNSGSNRRNRSGSMGDEDDVDPREDPTKRDTFIWLDELEEKLNLQLSEMEEKMEGYKATSKKKKTSAATNDALMDDLQHKMDRHTYHIERIQLIKDRLEHSELEVTLVEEIHDDLDYFANSHSEVDFQEDETLYDALELDKEIERDDDEDHGPEDGAESSPPIATDDSAAAASSSSASAEQEDQEETGEDGAAAGTVGAILKSAGARTPTKTKAASTAASASSASAVAAPKPSSSPQGNAPAVAKGRTPTTAAATPSVPTPVAAPVAVQGQAAGGAGKGGESLASIIAKNTKVATPAPAPATTPTPVATNKASPSKSTTTTPGPPAITGPSPSTTPKPTGGLPTIAPAQLGRLPPGASAAAGGAKGMMPPPGLGTSQTPPPGLGTGVGAGGGGSAAELSGLPSTSLSGAANSFAQKDRTLVPDDYMLTLSLLEPSLRHLPDPIDSDRPKQYVPRNPYRTPAYFPSQPAPIFDDPILFDKLSVDTLFFIFYFQQGTPHQYLAARELKKQSWRYHKNFLTWFQRHDDPKITTEEYEQGTYVYFDYESGWCQRIKADFTFEYRHLEDELQVPIAATL